MLYTRDLTKYVINSASESEIVKKKQLKNKDINVFNGRNFNEKDNSTNIDFQDLVSVDESALESAFDINITQDDIEKYN